jgi:hypothetical protein
MRRAETIQRTEGICMAALIRKYKLPTGQTKEDRITDPDRIERYLGLFERADVKKLEAGEKVTIDKDEWQLVA